MKECKKPFCVDLKERQRALINERRKRLKKYNYDFNRNSNTSPLNISRLCFLVKGFWR